MQGATRVLYRCTVHTTTTHERTATEATADTTTLYVQNRHHKMKNQGQTN